MYTERETMLWVMGGLVAFAVALESARMISPAVREAVNMTIGRIMRPSEKRLFTGATYVAIACLLCIWWFPKPVAITALLFMSISDAAASLVGIKLGGPRFLGKSLSGCSAFLISALAVAWLTMPEHRWIGLIGAVVAMIVEATPLRWGLVKIDDNLAIPLISGAVMSVLLANG
ncbi:MAG: diacylglycerol/polyprenol kinase family protein [Phycisphaerae bacterium]